MLISISSFRLKCVLNVLTTFVMIAPHLSTQNHYCSISKDHTLCKFQGIGPRCKNPYEIGIPQKDRTLIMELHNSLRRMVATGNERRGRPGPQPMASNMRQMEWDDELAMTAQRLAEQCKYTHDCLNCRKVDRFLTGQNLYQFSENLIREGSNWEQAIMAWYDEVALYNPRGVDYFDFIKELGHYTQMLWADTYKIGCGYAYYNEGKWNRKLYVCNYGPAGNIITTQMYKRGTPCSECPEGTTCSNQYPGLCSAGGGRGGPSFFAPPPPTTRRPPPPPPTTPRPTTTTTRRTTTTTTTTTTPRPRPPTTTQAPSKIIFDEIESNEIGAVDNFRSPQPFEIASRFGSPTSSAKKNSVSSSSRNTFYNPSNNKQRNVGPTTIAPFRRSQKQETITQRPFSRFVTTRRTTTTTQRPRTFATTPYYDQFQTTFNNKVYYTSTTPKPIKFSPRVYTEQDQKPKSTNRRVGSSKDNRIPSGTINQSRFSSLNNGNGNYNSNFNGNSNRKSGTKAETKILRDASSVPHPALSVEDTNSIMLFCDFDYAKCPVRYMGQIWNYTAFETPGYGHGFASILSPGEYSDLQIRSDVIPKGSEGLICVHFRFVLYTFGLDGGPAKNTNGIGRDGKPVRFSVATIGSEGTGSDAATEVDITDRSASAYDWLIGRVQFRDLHSQFLLNFKVPANTLGDNLYVAVDDILITQGLCHT